MSRHSTKWYWSRCLLAAGLFGLAACGGGGGSDGGDDDTTGDDPAPMLPANLSFSGGLSDGVPMTLSVDGMNLSVTGFGFRGTWDRTANRYVLPANETFLNVDLGLSGVLATGVTATASWVGVAPPAQSGTISAQSLVDNFETPLFTGIASMTVLSESVVRLSWTGTVPPTMLDYSWDTFLDADLPQDWQGGIQAGVAVLAMHIDKVQMALDLFVFVNAQDTQLAAAGVAGVTTACAGGTGTRQVVWNDANRDGALGPADGFTVTYANCLVDLPGDIDQRLDGRVVISGYIENSAPFSVGGRADFVTLQQTETDVEALTLSTTGSIQVFVSGS
jgi:hypothetical protein